MKAKRYVHWLKIIGRTGNEDEVRQYIEIRGYLDRHLDASAEIFRYDFVLCDRVVRLECSECYNDLDMFVNSFSHSLRRLSRRPKNLIDRRPFEEPRYILDYLQRQKEQNTA